MFQASSAHLQEDTVVHVQHMVQHMLHVYNGILLKMST